MSLIGLGGNGGAAGGGGGTGPPGPTGPAGPDIDGLSSDGAHGIDVAGAIQTPTLNLTPGQADPIDPPTLTAIPPGDGQPAVAAGTYRFAYIWWAPNPTGFSPAASITVDGSTAIQIDLPDAPESATQYSILTDNGDPTAAPRSWPFAPKDVFALFDVPVAPFYFDLLDDSEALAGRISVYEDGVALNSTGTPTVLGQVSIGNLTVGELTVLGQSTLGDDFDDGAGSQTLNTQLTVPKINAHLVSASALWGAYQGGRQVLTDNYTVAVQADPAIGTYSFDYLLIMAASSKTITLPDPGDCFGQLFIIINDAAGDTTTVAGTINGATDDTLARPYDVGRYISTGAHYLKV